MADKAKASAYRAELRSGLARQLIYSHNGFMERWALWLFTGIFVIISYTLTFITVKQTIQIKVAVVSITPNDANNGVYLIATASKDSLDNFRAGDDVELSLDNIAKQNSTPQGKLSTISPGNASDNFSAIKIYIPHYSPVIPTNKTQVPGNREVTIYKKNKINLLAYLFRKILTENINL